MLVAVTAMGSCAIAMSSCDGQKWTEEQKGSYNLVIQQGGQTLGYSPTSGVQLITDKGYAFKDLNNDGTDEMVLGCEYENNIYPAGLYTIKDGEPYIPNIYMFSNIYDDGTLRVYGSDEAVQTEQFFRLKSNGELEHAQPGTDKDMTFNWHHI